MSKSSRKAKFFWGTQQPRVLEQIVKEAYDLQAQKRAIETRAVVRGAGAVAERLARRRGAWAGGRRIRKIPRLARLLQVSCRDHALAAHVVLSSKRLQTCLFVLTDVQCELMTSMHVCGGKGERGVG